MRTNRSQHMVNLALSAFLPAVIPAAVLAQETRPAPPTVPQPVVEHQQAEPERSTSTNDLPRLAEEYARASAQLDEARQQRTVALTELNLTRSRVRREMMESGDVERARAAMATAEDQYIRERDRVIDRLQSDPSYVADRKKAAEIDAKLASLRQRVDVADNRTTALAVQRLHYAAEADQIEQNALERDAAYQQARERYIAAVREYRAAIDQLEQRVEADPEVQQARQRWQDARDDWQDARTRLAGVQAAYMTALQERRQDMQYLQTHSPPDPWYPYGMGFGGYGGYGVVVR